MMKPWKCLQTITLLVLGANQPYIYHQIDEMSILQAWYDLDLKIKNVSLNSQTLQIVLDLSPISYQAIQFYFSNKAILTSTFKAYHDLNLKSKVVTINGEILEINSDLSPISDGGHLTARQSYTSKIKVISLCKQVPKSFCI